MGIELETLAASGPAAWTEPLEKVLSVQTAVGTGGGCILSGRTLMPYTPEDVRRIGTGLASGKRPGYRPETDAEFLKRYDPERYQRERVINVLEEIRDSLNAKRT